MKKTIGWIAVLALSIAGVALYAFVPAVRDAIASWGAAREDTDYWCPMHPEIVRKGPGACPV